LLDRSERPRAGGQRTVKPSLAALASVWRGVEPLDNSWRDFTRTIIALPARRNEVAGMRWEHLDFVARLWRQPDKVTKNGNPHQLYLHELVLDILQARHITAGKLAEGLVFKAPRSGKQILAFSALKRAIDRLAPEVKEWRAMFSARTVRNDSGPPAQPLSSDELLLLHVLPSAWEPPLSTTSLVMTLHLDIAQIEQCERTLASLRARLLIEEVGTQSWRLAR
jgi:integrase